MANLINVIIFVRITAFNTNKCWKQLNQRMRKDSGSLTEIDRLQVVQK